MKKNKNNDENDLVFRYFFDIQLNLEERRGREDNLMDSKEKKSLYSEVGNKINGDFYHASSQMHYLLLNNYNLIVISDVWKGPLPSDQVPHEKHPSK